MVRLLFLGTVVCPLFLYASDSLVLPKGDGTLSVETSFQTSSGAGEKYYDTRLVLGAAYGLTKNVSIWFDFPLVHRKETDLSNDSDWGVSDTWSGLRWRFWQNQNVEFGLGLSGRFPTADTDVGYNGPPPGTTAELPLGMGTWGYRTRLMARETIGRRWSFEQSAAYVLNFASRVEFLQTNPFEQEIDGTVYTLPGGNTFLDWGDEVDLRGAVAIQPTAWLELRGRGRYLYRRSTRIQTQTISGAAGTTQTIAIGTIVSPSAQAFFAQPEMLLRWKNGIDVRAAVEIPVWEKNYPTLSFVESFTGNRYQLEVRYAF